MDPKILKVIKGLEKKSAQQKKIEHDLAEKDKMLAITYDTGKFINIMLRSLNAKRVLEVGLSHGFSTLWIADAVKSNLEKQMPSGRRQKKYPKYIKTIEHSKEKINIAKKNFSEAGISDLIEIKQGFALDLLNSIKKKTKESRTGSNKFEFIFLDADKENLKKYFDICFYILKPGGIILTDNMLYPTKYSSKMKSYKQHILRQYKGNLESVTVPIGNGEEVTMKSV